MIQPQGLERQVVQRTVRNNDQALAGIDPQRRQQQLANLVADVGCVRVELDQGVAIRVHQPRQVFARQWRSERDLAHTLIGQHPSDQPI